MPTVRTVTVKPSGGDYTSLAAALAGEAADLVSLDRQLTIECYAMLDTAQALVGGFTTDSTRYIRITVPESERHQGTRDNTKYRIVASPGFGGASIEIGQPYTRIEHVQVSTTGGSTGGIHTSVLAEFIGCLVYDVPAWGFVFNLENPVAPVFINCIAVHCGGDGFGAAAGVFLNCASVNNGGRGFLGDTRFGRVTQIKNCYAAGNTGVDYDNTDGMDITSSYSEDGSASTPTTAFSTSSGGYFTNVTPGSEDLHIGSSSALRDAGTDLSADPNWIDPDGSVDIAGQSRDASWDVGPFEFVSANSIPIFRSLDGSRFGSRRLL